MPIPTQQFIKPATRGSGMHVPMAISPSRIAYAWRSAENGNPEHLYAVLEHFLKIDDEIRSATQSVHSAVLGGGYSIQPKEDGGDEAVRQAAFFEKLFTTINFEELVRELMFADYFGVQAIGFPEDAWDVVEVDSTTYQGPVNYEVIPLSWISADKINRNDDFNALHIGDQPADDFDRGSLIIATERKLPGLEDIDFTRFGYGVAAMRFAGFKYFDYEDWAAFNETFATPMILGKTGPGGQQDVVKKAVTEMAHDARAVVGENDEISFPESNKSSSVDAYDRFAEKIDKAISKIIKSESLTDNMGNRGSFAAMKTTNGVRMDVALNLARKVTRIIHMDLMKPLAEWNFTGPLLAGIKFNVKGNVDMTSQIRVDRELNKMMPGSEKHLRKKYSYPPPADDEDSVRRQASGSILGG